MNGHLSTKHSQDKSDKQDKGRPREQTRPPTVSGPRADILALQRAAGNQAVSQSLQSETAGSVPGGNGIPPIIRSVLNSGGGQSLDPATRTLMESRFGHDFSQVRIHTDTDAQKASQSLNSKAFTVGGRIFLDRASYQPDSTDGKKLLAHELAHVVQQREAFSGNIGMGQPGDRFEHEADAAAQSLVQGNPFLIQQHAMNPRLQMQQAQPTTREEKTNIVRQNYIKAAEAKRDEIKEALEKNYLWPNDRRKVRNDQSLQEVLQARKKHLEQLINYLNEFIRRLGEGENYGCLRAPDDVFCRTLNEVGPLPETLVQPLEFHGPLTQLVHEEYGVDLSLFSKDPVGREMGWYVRGSPRKPTEPTKQPEGPTPAPTSEGELRTPRPRYGLLIGFPFIAASNVPELRGRGGFNISLSRRLLSAVDDKVNLHVIGTGEFIGEGELTRKIRSFTLGLRSDVSFESPISSEIFLSGGATAGRLGSESGEAGLGFSGSAGILIRLDQNVYLAVEQNILKDVINDDPVLSNFIIGLTLK